MYTTPGRNPIIELLSSQIECLEVFIDENLTPDDKINQIIKLANKKQVKVTRVSNKQLGNMVSKDVPHQGVIAKASRFSPELNIKELNPDSLEFYIYVREAQHEHNAAAIIRTAECFGVSGVILPTDYDLHPNLTRIAMGANFHIPTSRMSIFQAIKSFKSAGFQTVAIEINGTKRLDQVNLQQPTLLIVGGEDRSISDTISNKIDELAVIPQSGHVNSLNMSVAASLAIYEWNRQSFKH